MRLILVQIANSIRQGRAAAKLSQRQLAARLKVSAGAVGRWESGSIKPSISNRVQIATLLHIPLKELLPEAKSMPPDVLSRPLVIAIVQQVLKLPERVQEAILAQISVTAEALEGPAAPSQDKPSR
jgi:transcriptional regulator with XRE-family HTH domain